MKSLRIIVCTKNGQVEKELDFKTLLAKLIRFIHNLSTETVEK